MASACSSPSPATVSSIYASFAVRRRRRHPVTPMRQASVVSSMTGSARWVAVIAGLLALFGSLAAQSAPIGLPGMEIHVSGAEAKPQEVATAIRILIVLTVLSLAPAILIMMTSFTRIIIVLAMLRHAFGMQETPPNTV